MTLELNRSQKLIQKAAWEFARGEFDRDDLLELEKTGKFPKKIWKKAADLGFIGLHFEEKFSGGGLGIFDTLLTAEAFCRKDSSCGMAIMFSGFTGELIMAAGTPDQKKQYLEPLALGKSLCGGAFFEPESGYELSPIRTHAVHEMGTWVITGKKTRVVNGAGADFFPVLCETKEGPGLILVEKNAPGLIITPMGRKLGNTMTPWADLEFDGVKADSNQILGPPGKGLELVKDFLAQARLINAGMALGIAQGAMDRTLSHAKTREQFGRKIATFQHLRHKIADMALKIELARGIAYGAAQAYDNKNKAQVLSAMAMEYACEAAEAVADEAVQIHGGYGYMREGEVEHFYRDAKFLRLFCSNSRLRKDIIADDTLGHLKSANIK
ncbi:MAG: acyl-CoA/acyl-ACP dehydrogenase [Desulfobacteraceae bacterium]|nr:acyl-CoA/acyl-ACP dehydrogenase [Desulfobacteraceae bacterium]